MFTFVFSWIDYSDGRKKFQDLEADTILSEKEKTNARLLQSEYHTFQCPICLESFKNVDQESLNRGKQLPGVNKIDKIGNERNTGALYNDVPMIGSDGLPLKLLRCGHVLDQSCWNCWVESSKIYPSKCPICRQDIGRSYSKRSERSFENSRHIQSDHVDMIRLRTIPIWEIRNQYGSLSV